MRQTSLGGGPPVRLIGSAASKFNITLNKVAAKMGSSNIVDDAEPQNKHGCNLKLSQEDAIPAATYDPSGDMNAEESCEASDSRDRT